MFVDNAVSSANTVIHCGIVGISTMTFMSVHNLPFHKSVAGLHRAYPSATLDKIYVIRL